jgi:hypothetical protein
MVAIAGRLVACQAYYIPNLLWSSRIQSYTVLVNLDYYQVVLPLRTPYKLRLERP